MKDSGRTGGGIVAIIFLIIGFILFAQYAVATNPCNTKAYKKSLPSYRSSIYRVTATPVPTAKMQTTPMKSTDKTRKGFDSLDTSDYVAPEDFYDWNKDDFYDYEEAEDYYYSHGGK